ncbi:hypothetical protein BVC80_1837g89 [Macleaya cordata]|uniref:DUF7356 domain-containing protein n=1 Tax=Macleaya cordata TaxID=56857 RepID=A0A200R3J9_MACCD|nr:hypothetical protein BVC80_1837g89 [Macleaya cordata]
MDRNRFLAVLILVVLVVSDGSDAALLGKFRRMVGLEPDGKARLGQISPSPGPISETGSDPSSVNSNISTSTNPQIPPIPGNPKKVNPRDASSKDKNQEGIDEKCEASWNSCTDHKNMIACLHPQHPENKETGLQEFFLLVQNEGESNLEVKITVPASIKMDLKQLQIPRHQAKKINVSVNVEASSTLILTAGSEECVLHTGVPIPQPQGKFFPSFQQIPSYTTLVSPIYGAYVLFVIALIVGGSWACCKFGKRGQQHGSGVPYQELEMGSGSAVNVETADGWDQSWDDDWDEEKAVKSPGGKRTGNLSANGLTSRPSSRDEWGNGWDD